MDLDTLLSESDILSIHAPLNEYTEGLMDKDAFCKMKSDAILLNLGRGPIINESDLADALNAGEIRAAGLDVLSVEPMAMDSPLLNVKDKDRLFITPHIAWATIEEADEDHRGTDSGVYGRTLRRPQCEAHLDSASLHLGRGIRRMVSPRQPQ